MYLPRDVKWIIDTFYECGYEAYAVGGCVRDMILGREPEDWDITTSAMPEEIKTIFYRTFDTGIEHGTITVLLNGVGYEVTTYRIDGEYEDSRHPSEVEFTRNLEDDLQRRDFTINAMAYNEQEGLIDIFGGNADIEKKIIRCVGDPEARFGEDALRILRGIRFSAQLGFQIEGETSKGIKKLAHTLENISVERIQVEMVKLLTSPNPTYIRKAFEMGITAVIFPEWDEMMVTTQENIHHQYTVGIHTLEALRYTRANKILRLTTLLHDVAKTKCKTMEDGMAHFYGHDVEGEVMTREILRRWKCDNDTIRKVSKLVLFHDHRMEATARNVRRAMNKISKELFPLYLEVRYADIMAQSDYQREDKLKNLEEIKVLYAEILEKDECTTLKQLAVTGRDLLACGIIPGKELGDMLDILLRIVIEEPECNTREYLIGYVNSYLKGLE